MRIMMSNVLYSRSRRSVGHLTVTALTVFILLVQAGLVSAAPLPTTGGWASSQSPIGLHVAANAILLPNGKVLAYGLRYAIAADTWEPQYTPVLATGLIHARILALSGEECQKSAADGHGSQDNRCNLIQYPTESGGVFPLLGDADGPAIFPARRWRD
jgi:hypothetical protein